MNVHPIPGFSKRCLQKLLAMPAMYDPSAWSWSQTAMVVILACVAGAMIVRPMLREGRMPDLRLSSALLLVFVLVLYVAGFWTTGGR